VEKENTNEPGKRQRNKQEGRGGIFSEQGESTFETRGRGVGRESPGIEGREGGEKTRTAVGETDEKGILAEEKEGKIKRGGGPRKSGEKWEGEKKTSDRGATKRKGGTNQAMEEARGQAFLTKKKKCGKDPLSAREKGGKLEKRKVGVVRKNRTCITIKLRGGAPRGVAVS